MANEQRTAGFLQAIGLGEDLATPQPQQIRGGGEAAAFANISRTSGRGPLTQGLAGLVGGTAGLVSGDDDGRSVKGFLRNTERGVQAFNDGNLARDMGISVETLQGRRKLQEDLKNVSVGGGSLEEQINAAEQIARMANATGDIEIAMNAATMRAQLEAQLEAQKKAGIASDQAELTLEDAKGLESIGIEAQLVGEDGIGKAVRIDAERAEAMGIDPKEIGRFMYLDEQGNRSIVDGAQLIPIDSAFAKFGIGGVAPKDDNILKMATANGATSGNIGKMRGSLVDAGKNAAILTDVSDLLLSMSNPEFALDLTGKTSIQVNRVVQFADNAANIISESNNGVGSSASLGAYEWDGQAVQGPAAQRSEFVRAGSGNLIDRLNNLASEAGVSGGQDLTDFLPTGIMDKLAATGASVEDIARVSEQYWSNVMELAYMDARLQEPSNRGLSDKDIDNALRRIGAATANPRSFAERQQTLLRRLDDAVDSLGNTITVPQGARTSRNQVVDFIYAPGVRQSVRRSIAVAQSRLEELSATQGAAPEGAAPAGLSARQRAEALEGFSDMSPEDQAALIRLEEAQ
jgi:hypothetical protein